MTAPAEISSLIARFQHNHEAYLSPGYHETQFRVEFLDPFFIALGWDVHNASGFAEPYKDVVHEAALKVGGVTKAPDYCFRIGGARKFFLEAKKPGVDLKHNPEPAFQLRRYAWSAKLPLSVLSDFEEFAVYDCRIKPAANDKASAGRILYLAYTEYLERWSEIADIFAKDAVLKGSFDQFAETTRKKKGTAEVDSAFLQEIEAWRDQLAKNIALRNPRLNTRQLNFAVQATLDRIIFLRICEDRGIEQYGRLQALHNGERVYQRLFHLFANADDRYNSGLFHFKKEKDRPEPDTLTPGLVLDDKVLKEILKSLYYPESPYEFSVLPADILGQVYEQFLGKVIRLTAGHQAKVEEKPEVKKAGGVYYTPTYIVDYIVKNTVGKLLQGKSPEEVSGNPTLRQAAKGGLQKGRGAIHRAPVGATGRSPLRILDPACGSGSFLLGAYQYLLDWHRDQYIHEAHEKNTKEEKSNGQDFRGAADLSRALRASNLPIYQTSGGAWRLTTAERKRILLDHIFGVDIDPQAVEVTKLSLLLKCLEGETEESLNQLKLFYKQRALPDLSANIKCGNSLIGSDFYHGQQMAMFDQEEILRINAFDWDKEFPEVFSRKDAKNAKEEAGFDVVIGNPPYIRIQTMSESTPLDAKYFKRHYAAASKGNYDIYAVFVEKSLKLLTSKGCFGFILPHKFFNAKYGQPLRDFLARGKHLAEVVHFGDQQVFEGASNYTCLLFLEKAGRDQCRVLKIDDLPEWRRSGKAAEGIIASSTFTADEWNFAIGPGASLLERLQKMPTKLEHVTSRIFQGLKTSADAIFIVEEIKREKKKVKVYSKEKEADYWLESDLLHPLIKGGDSKPYYLAPTKRLILFPYARQPGGSIGKIPEATMKSDYPLTWDYLLANKLYLENRERGKMRGRSWYAYGRNQALDVMNLPKIFTPDIAVKSSFSLDESGELYFTGGVAGGYGILVLPQYSHEYILGLLNSKLLEWYIHQTATTMRGGYFSYESRFIRNLPIRIAKNQEDNTRHDKIEELVKGLLDLNVRLASVKTAHERETIQRQIEATDQEIDKLVFRLYDFNEEEIDIVEES